jgi:hypothetical protein
MNRQKSAGKIQKSANIPNSIPKERFSKKPKGQFAKNESETFCVIDYGGVRLG